MTGLEKLMDWVDATPVCNRYDGDIADKAKELLAEENSKIKAPKEEINGLEKLKKWIDENNILWSDGETIVNKLNELLAEEKI